MFNVCPGCGEYSADKIVSGDVATCPECGHGHRFRRLPLFLVGGASGSGKSTLCLELAGGFDEVVVLDSDLLWRDELASRPGEYFELWLRACKNIGQSGRPVVLFGAGFAVPDNIEPRVERRYFSAVHYLATVCDETELRRRLIARPAWRGSSRPKYLDEHIAFNRWFRDRAPNARPPIALFDTTGRSVVETAEALRAHVSAWLA